MAQVVFSRENPDNNNITVNNRDQRIIFVDDANILLQSREMFNNNSSPSSDRGYSPRSDNLSSPRSENTSLGAVNNGTSEIV